MGIVNCTPDSFYTGSGAMPSHDALCRTIADYLAEGADFLDLGGYSTRPGAAEVSLEEEWQRVAAGLAAVREVCRERSAPPMVSIDTFRSEVARRAIECYDDLEVALINDVTGGEADNAMYDLVATSGVRYVAMHMRGTPQTMQQLTAYDDVVEEVVAELSERVTRMRAASVRDEQIILDPGFGFAKELDDNYRLVAALDRISALGYPLLVGVSRKSMISRALDLEKSQTLPATTALHWELLRRGASILRVHDVAAARQVVDLYNYYEKIEQR